MSIKDPRHPKVHLQNSMDLSYAQLWTCQNVTGIENYDKRHPYSVHLANHLVEQSSTVYPLGYYYSLHL